VESGTAGAEPPEEAPAALPDALLESELFGHVRGAFTGAERDRDGLLMVAAEGGTLFLDEIGETSLAMQAKLLRALEQREVRPVGGTRSRAVNFRLVCATNRGLAEEARKGAFREDLYYRIGVVELSLPPLRERLEDLPELTRRILARAAEELDRPVPVLSADAMKVLLSQRWPGNVRQLQNVLRAAFVMAEGDLLEPRHLPLSAIELPAHPAHSRAERDAREKARILEALEATDWNATAAAQRAGISRATLYRKLQKHGIEPGRRT
jgi:serine/threonine-protein kinase PknK